MVLVDTAVWVDHFHRRDPQLFELLENEHVLMHPMVVGELALGYLADRQQVLADLIDMPEISVATNDEVLFFIEHHRLMGSGIGYVDAHLLTACVLHGATRLWTRDRRMSRIADELGIGFPPN